ncbi:cysteine-rich small domain-containing protein [Coprococcus eutactus]|jgi:Zn-finger protein|uniref:cysteine-rich small domain-containing protein n=1 Tax=Coprococcus eutactus TaxID=33043 RepID=UPI0027D263F5|nr:cysteine-rich small domain-containing protein [Coprococcus eutactus]
MISNSYRFFQNRECEFFPCHEVQDEDAFNCLFCYCPLYLDDNCLGSPEYIITGRGQRIKDCSSCLVVHSPEMYDKVIAHLRRQDEIIRVDLRKMKSLLMDRLFKITHINDMDEDMRAEHRQVADRVVNGIMTGSLATVSNPMEVSVLLQPFAGECVHKGYLEFGNKKIECNVLEQIDTAGVEKGYLYAFHAPDVDLESAGSVLEQYYMETFQVACMDVIRGWIQGYLERKNCVYEKKYCSPSFGPGYYGMGMDAVPELLGLMDASQVGVSWNGERMSPKMSLVGAYLIAGEDVFEVDFDCRDCIGQSGGCEFCIKH